MVILITMLHQNPTCHKTLQKSIFPAKYTSWYTDNSNSSATSLRNAKPLSRASPRQAIRALNSFPFLDWSWGRCPNGSYGANIGTRINGDVMGCLSMFINIMWIYADLKPPYNHLKPINKVWWRCLFQSWMTGEACARLSLRMEVGWLSRKRVRDQPANQRLKMAIEIVDLPINSMVIFHSYVSLPEGSWNVPVEFGIASISQPLNISFSVSCVVSGKDVQRPKLSCWWFRSDSYLRLTIIFHPADGMTIHIII
jgi:hypothetical protein